MKYFTPQLYVLLNSRDDSVIDRAEAKWSKAFERYKKRFERIASELPDELRHFCLETYSHDAEMVGLTKAARPSSRRRFAELVIRQGNKLATLTYTLTEKPHVEKPVDSPVFLVEQPRWLYDEVDLVKPGLYSHSILLSSGYVLAFLFTDFEYDESPLIHPLRESGVAEAPLSR